MLEVIMLALFGAVAFILVLAGLAIILAFPVLLIIAIRIIIRENR